jgi:hypothetical protein
MFVAGGQHGPWRRLLAVEGPTTCHRRVRIASGDASKPSNKLTTIVVILTITTNCDYYHYRHECNINPSFWRGRMRLLLTRYIADRRAV